MKGSASSPGWVAAAWSSRAVCLLARYGEMKDVMAMVEESANSLATYFKILVSRLVSLPPATSAAAGGSPEDGETHLGYPSDVLVAVLLGEAQVLVQPEARIIAVQPVGGQTEMQQVLLQRRGDGRLARGRQPRKPYRQSALLAQAVALVARQAGMPSNVAALCISELALPRHSISGERRAHPPEA